MILNVTHDDVARQFVNEDRTIIRGSRPYKLWRDGAEQLAGKLIELKNPTAVLMAEELLWYRDVFANWTPQKAPTDEERNRFTNEFLLAFQKYTGYHAEAIKPNRAGLR